MNLTCAGVSLNYTKMDDVNIYEHLNISEGKCDKQTQLYDETMTLY